MTEQRTTLAVNEIRCPNCDYSRIDEICEIESGYVFECPRCNRESDVEAWEVKEFRTVLREATHAPS